MNSLVLRTDHEGVATLTMNRSEKCNALCKEVFEELDEHLETLRRETRTVGLVVLRGAGDNFSAGYDMEEVLQYVKANAKPHYHSEVIDKLANLPQPVISAVKGHCSTGALELALAADLIVSNESAQFSDVYARWGLTPIWGLSLRLPHRVGSAKASDAAFANLVFKAWVGPHPPDAGLKAGLLGAPAFRVLGLQSLGDATLRGAEPSSK